MIWTKIIFGGLGRRGFEAVVASLVLAAASALVAGSLMVVQGARYALTQAERNDRPEIVQIRSRFNRALFETPRSGNLPPLTLPVYEPLIEPEQLSLAAGDGTIVARQSLFRNVVSGDRFLNVYIFGIDPVAEAHVSSFSLTRGRFLRSDDGAVAVLDEASARALGVDLDETFPVRKADGEDLELTVVGIIGKLELRDAPPRTVEAPALAQDSSFVSSGVFVTLHTSEAIFGRTTLTDALVVARTPTDVPSLADALREAFRLEPGVFVTERYSQFMRKVHDFVLTLSLFTLIGTATALLAGLFAANLLHDVYADRRRHYATLIALGVSPARVALAGLSLGLAAAFAGTITAVLMAIFFGPTQFALPSLMADLGTIEPRFDLFVAAAMAAIALAAVALGITPTWRRLLRHPMATALSENGR
jgi:ABC-type antimicrobial peptide transport system permease subunit